MSISLYQLNRSEWVKGQKYIDALWRHEHILARDEQLFKWQFRSIYAPEKLNFFIAEDNNCPVGCIGRMDLPCHRQGRPLLGAAMTNLICLPQYRKIGLGMQIMQKAYEGLNYVASIGINVHVAKLYHMLGQYILEVMPRYICVSNLDILIETLQHTEHAENINIDYYKKCNRLRYPSACSCHIEEIDADSSHQASLLEKWDICWQEYFAPRLQGVVKDASYIRWRYLDHPIFHYKVLLAKSMGGEVQGMAVLRLAALPADACAVRVLEFLAMDENTGLSLATAIAERIPENAAFVEHISLGKQWLPLQHIGMSKEGSELFSVYFNPPDLSHCTITSAFHIINTGVSAEEFICSDNTYITIADCDQDRPN